MHLRLLVPVVLFSLLSLSFAPPERTEVYSYQFTVSNVHIVQQGDAIIMIDSGTKGMRKRLAKYLAEEGLGFADIDYLILTHAHPDHAGNAAYLQQTFGTRIVVGQADSLALSQGEPSEPLCFTSFSARMLWPFLPHKFEAAAGDLFVGDTLDMNPWGIDGRIFPMAGHTQGSLVVQVGHRAFVGDLVRGRPLNKTRPTLHYYMCDEADNREDILRLCRMPEIDIWFTGHFGELDPKEVKAAFL